MGHKETKYRLGLIEYLHMQSCYLTTLPTPPALASAALVRQTPVVLKSGHYHSWYDRYRASLIRVVRSNARSRKHIWYGLCKSNHPTCVDCAKGCSYIALLRIVSWLVRIEFTLWYLFYFSILLSEHWTSSLPKIYMSQKRWDMGYYDITFTVSLPVSRFSELWIRSFEPLEGYRFES